MVLMRRLLPLLMLSLAGGPLGCRKPAPPARVIEAMPVTMAWVVDREGQGDPVDAPSRLVSGASDRLAERNLLPSLVEDELYGPSFGIRRATPHRLSWLRERYAKGEGLTLLAELRPWYDNLSQGRYRWIVAVVLTVGPADDPARDLDLSFEVPVFLNVSVDGPDQAIDAARPEILRRLMKLVDTALEDPDASWTLDVDEDAPTGGGPPPVPTRASGVTPPPKDEAPDDDLDDLDDGGTAVWDPHGPIYLALVDRFANGDTTNDGADADVRDDQGWHGGDLAGLEQRLDHIADLGFSTIWMTPITTSQRGKTGETGAFHGYWMRDPATLDPHLGTLDDLASLRDAAAERGLGLVYDVVTNHVGYDSPLPAERPDWFHGNGPVQDWDDPVQTRTSDVHGLPDLDQGHPEVARWLLDAAEGWMRTGPVGFRLDAMRHVDPDFLARFNAFVDARTDDDFLTIGELFEGDPAVLAEGWRSTGFRQIFDFPLHYALVDSVCGEREPARLAAVVSDDRRYPDPTQLVTFLDNHDRPRIRGLCGSDAAVSHALTLLYGLRGIPSVQYGTEAGFDAVDEPRNRADMHFDGPMPQADHLRRLARLRRGHPALRAELAWPLVASEQAVAWLRAHPEELVVVSYSREPTRLTLPAGLPEVTAATSLLTGEPVVTRSGVAGGMRVLEVGAGAHLVALTLADADERAAFVARLAQPDDVTVRFEVEAPRAEALRVAGSGPELGGWQADEALVLSREGDAWVGEVRVPAGVVLAWKLVADDATWEVTTDRYVLATHDVTVRGAWTRG